MQIDWQLTRNESRRKTLRAYASSAVLNINAVIVYDIFYGLPFFKLSIHNISILFVTQMIILKMNYFFRKNNNINMGGRCLRT